MPRRSFSDGSRGDERLIRQLPALLLLSRRLGQLLDGA